ncbi:MAG: excinuclease ABC subunit UvrB [Eubacteriales bacterium]|nr:excinuclease ABC subunit UvrB [Eubacteriales bacterium]
MEKFELVSKYQPTGDQPQAIEKITEGIEDGLKYQTLLGVTGSGKTFTMANIIKNLNRPALVIAHNKTLAAQLCNEFREFFPHNRVEYFVSYYDYYQPEAYIVSSDTYIEKDMSINDEIDKLRHSATCSLFERNDVIVVASVSCIYGLGAPENYSSMCISLRPHDHVDRNEVIKKLLSLQYMRNEIDFKRGTFRSKGDILDVIPASSSDVAIRFEFFDDEIESISEIDIVTGRRISSLNHAFILPASHYAVSPEKLENAFEQIKQDCLVRVSEFEKQGKLIEAQRIKERVFYDLEMMKEVGYCSGIENYSRYFDGRSPGEPPYTLLDYFKKNFIMFIDESHISIPQIRGMYAGDLSRKTNLVEYGFRLPAAYDNRPLNFKEFEQKINQVVFVSATPGPYELEHSDQVVEQIIRPTGLLDPPIEVRKIEGQIDDLITEIYKTIDTNGRVLVTTLTKKMAENLTGYLSERKIKVRYLHSDIDTLERVEIINSLRLKEFDVLIGINLLREGLDIPEVKLVAILDADKEGFLRSSWALIQTIGRAARNADAKVIMYADNITDSMKVAIDETNRRRAIQSEYNKIHHITPTTIIKPVKNTLEITKKESSKPKVDKKDIPNEINKLTALMKIASDSLDFEQAIILRNQIAQLKKDIDKKD